MDALGAEVDGAARVDEVVDANASLRGEVPDAGVGVGAVVLRVVGRPAEGWVLVVGPQDATGCLAPEGEVPSASQVHAKDDGSDGHSAEGAAYGVEGGTDGRRAGRIRAEGALEFGSVGLPEGEELATKFEVAAEGAVAVGGSDDFTDLYAGHEEFEVVAVFSEAGTPLDDGAYLEGVVVVLMEGGDVVVDDGLRGDESGGGEQEGEGADCGRSDALRAGGQAMSPVVSGRRKPPVNGGRLKLATGGLVAGTGHSGFVEVEVGVDVLSVVEVFEGFEEADHGVGLSALEFRVGRSDLGDFGVLGGDLCGLESFGDGFEVFGVGEDFPVVAFVGEIFRAGVENDFGQLVFAGGRFSDGDDALFGEHPGDCTFGAEIATVLGEGVADFADSAIFVVGEDFDDEGDAAGAVSFVSDFLVGDAFEFTGAALDGSLDVFGGHVLRFGGSDSTAEARVAVGIAATAGFGGNGDFLDEAGEDLATLGVESALFMLDCRPF